MMKVYRFSVPLSARFRWFSSSAVAAPLQADANVSKELLMKLRKKTGYSFVNCKKALLKFGEDLPAAEAYLNDLAIQEGWNKSEKLQFRTAAQGLIGIAAFDNHAIITEVNCETDFVAKNEKFQTLVSSIAKGCSALARTKLPLAEQTDKWNFAVDDIAKQSTSDSKTIADLLAFTVGQVSEKIVLKRAACLAVREGIHLAAYAHPRGTSFNSVLLGQYGALLAFTVDGSKGSTAPLELLGQQICQHIVGMNPKSVGTPLTPEERQKLAEAARLEAERQRQLDTIQMDVEGKGETSEAPPQASADEESAAPTILSDESQLLRQDFLLNPDMTMHEYLQAQHCTVLDFVRFGCGDETAQ